MPLRAATHVVGGLRCGKRFWFCSGLQHWKVNFISILPLMSCLRTYAETMNRRLYLFDYMSWLDHLLIFRHSSRRPSRLFPTISFECNHRSGVLQLARLNEKWENDCSQVFASIFGAHAEKEPLLSTSWRADLSRWNQGGAYATGHAFLGRCKGTLDLWVVSLRSVVTL